MAFALYSTDIIPTTNPAVASPPPASLAVFDQDPIFGEYDFLAGSIGRGSVQQAFGGVIVQDFGGVAGDGRIRIAERDAMSQAVVDSIQTMHDAVDGEYYFTDGIDVRRVKFARPDGFRAWRNLLWAAKDHIIFSYEINLIVIAEGVHSDARMVLSCVTS